MVFVRARLSQFAEKWLVFWLRGMRVSFKPRFSPFRLSCCSSSIPTIRFFLPVRSPPYVSVGINFAMRIRLQAAAAKRNTQSTRRRLRNFVFLSPATNFIQPNTFSTNLRFC